MASSKKGEQVRRIRRAFTLAEFLIVWALCIIVPALIMSPWTWRTLEFWASYSKGMPAGTPYWVALLASIIWPLTFALNVVSEIVRCFI